MVANAELLVMVTSVAIRHRAGFVDRRLVAAYAGGLSLLCLTKTDLADPAPFAAQYAELDLPVLTTRRDDPDSVNALADVLAGGSPPWSGSRGREVDAG